MRRGTRLYNILLPVWLLWILPPVWLIILPGNLLVDMLVVLAALAALKRRDRRRILGRLWWRVWLLGFAADAVGVAWLLLGSVSAAWVSGSGWAEAVGYVMHDPFGHPVAFLWTAAAVALSGACIYRFDRKALGKIDGLTDRESCVVALSLAVVTAPWTFFIPVY